MNVGQKKKLRSLITNIPFLSEYIFRKSTFSQEGEDRLLMRLIGHLENGFYVDIGAHHPFRFSNTHLFYQKGWRGINVDALPGSMAPFRKYRRHDINIEAGIAEHPGSMDYHMFNDPALNTFDPEIAAKYDRAPYKLESIVRVDVLPLRTILDQHMPDKATFAFLSVDVEGLDLQVLRSGNWEEYRPMVVVVETTDVDISKLSSDPVTAFMDACGYTLYAKTINSSFFVSRDCDVVDHLN